VLITVAHGLGLVMARQLACSGARLAPAPRDAASLERAELAARGADVPTVPCDITNKAQVDEMERTHPRSPRPDRRADQQCRHHRGWPNGVMTLEDYSEAMQTHFWAPLYMTLAVLPEMRQRRSGRIVNISSIGGKVSVPHLLPYSAVNSR